MKVSIKLMERSLAMQHESIDSIKSTSRTILATSSVVVALLGALQLINVKPDDTFSWLYWILIGLAILAYLVVVTYSSWVISPLKLSGPVPEDWDILYATFVDKNNIIILRTLLMVYLNAIEENKPILKRVVRQTRVASVSLVIAVLILVGLSLIPRYHLD